ncbi:ECF transporter S component [Sporolactobacillus pectinivorans]|uniref:ECF transporter S component n=1 Tax=Sporolactobacillus pectinivorans TaxID=1591408 RepID=UPI000C2569B3|nr:ECF transporter S component [Sporolactobacillus pectinivorans]
MSKEKNSFEVRDIVLTGLFAALTFLGVFVLHFQLPAAVGGPFIHFGNAFLVLSVLLLGGVKGGIAGAVGLGLSDLVDGYASTSPVTVILAVIVAAVVAGALRLFKHNDTVLNIFFIAVIAGASKIVLEFIHGAITLLVTGSAFGPAVIGSFTSLPATAINAVSTVIIVTVLYIPLKKGLDIFNSNKGVSKA